MFFQTAGLPPLVSMYFERERQVMVPGSLDGQVVNVAETARQEPTSAFSIATVSQPWYKTKWFAIVATIAIILLVVVVWMLMKKIDAATRRLTAGERI